MNQRREQYRLQKQLILVYKIQLTICVKKYNNKEGLGGEIANIFMQTIAV